MPKNSSGTYTSPASSWSPAINGALASAGDWNALLADISAALTDSLSRGGNGGMTANLAMGNNRITGLTAGAGAGQAVEWTQLFGAGTMADIASAATVDIGAQNTSFLRMTGTTTVTSFGSNFRGPRFITFEGAVLLTNSSTLVLPGGANITTAAGDTLIVIPGATAGTADKWIVVAYQKGNSIGQTDKIQPVSASVAANALTVTINPTTLDFRSTTLNSGVVSTRNIGTALSAVVPSGATLGTTNAVLSKVMILAIDNAGTVEVAVCNGSLALDESTLISTTALSADADSASVIYSTAARTNVPFRIVGFVESTQSTAGTWASAPSKVQGSGGVPDIKGQLNATGSAPLYACRAWVNFNGTGTVAIRASGNVSSITDGGTGVYTINFTTAMPDTSYSVTANCSLHSGVQDFVSVQIGSAMNTTSTAIRTYSSSNIFDPTTVCVAIFR